MPLTKYNKYTNDDVLHRRLRGAHDTLSSHMARTLSHLVMSSHTSLAQDLSLVINISIVIHERTSLSRFSLFLLPPVLPCLLFLPPPALRAVP